MRANAHSMFSASLPVVVLSIALAGCGKVDPGDGPHEPAPIAFDQFCAEFAQTSCDILMPCCNDGGFPLDAASCQSRFMSECTSRFLRPKTDTSWSAENAGRCIAELRASVIDCAENPDSPVDGPESSCRQLFVGVLPLGANCLSSTSCAPSASGKVVCLQPSGASIGICSLEELAAPGESCGDVSGTVVNCVPNSYCKFDSATATQSCVARAGAAAKCNPEDPRSCQDGLTCDWSSSTCASPHEVGERCNPSSMSACVESAYCEYSSSTCIAKKAVGAACTTPSQCASKHCLDGVCAMDNIASKDTCSSGATASAP